jgi:serine/threonine protein kinase
MLISHAHARTHAHTAGEIAAAAPDANTLEESAVFAGRFSDAYVLGKVIGEGSWAEVRQCVAAGKSNAEGGTVYAVKILKRDKSKRKHMQNEIAALTRAQHPHCVRLEDVFMEDEIYIVMEQLTGGTVLERIIEMDCYSEADARNVTSQVLVALDYLHGIGIVHRDLKPENLLYVSADPSSPQYDHVKLSDFGFSRASDYHAMHTTCGTPEYMAPEVLTMSAGGYGAKVDLWSMGVVLYVMLAGYFPFQSHSQPTLFRKIMQGEYDFPDAYWADVSEGAKDMIRGMLQADPARRIDALKGLKHAWITERESVSRKKLHGSHRAFLLIRRLPLFTDVSPECLQEVVNNLRFVRVDAGEHIMRSGDVGDSMYFINQVCSCVHVCLCVSMCVCVGGKGWV